jgi:hypothetical protein
VSDEFERIAAIGDPETRAREAGEAMTYHQDLVTKLARVRRAAVAELRASGLSYAQVAQRLGVTRGRIAQLGVDYGPERRFFGGELLTISIPLRAASLLEDRLVIAQEDEQAATQLANLAERMDLATTRQHVLPTGEVDFTPDALVLICGPKSSPVVNELIATTDPILEFSPDDAGRWRLLDKVTGTEFVSPLDREPKEERDYAYLARLKRPDGRPFLLIAGTHAIGSLGVVHFLSQASTLAWLYEEVDLNPFSMVVGSEFAGSPRQITSSEAITPPRRH